MTIAAKFLEIQEQLNQKLAVDWATKGWAYPDAMFTEATEAFNHLNWEWWRATDRVIDWDQVKLEVVDVAHFLISEVIATGNQKLFKDAVEDFSGMYKKEGFTSDEYNIDAIKKGLKHFIRNVLNYSLYDAQDIGIHTVINSFFNVAWRLKLHPEALFQLFVTKVCLNQLRWKNGYKKGINDGSTFPNKEFYIKTWDGVEDNVWLAEKARTLDPTKDSFKATLEAALDEKYKQVYEAFWNVNTR